MSKVRDLEGQRFGKLTVISRFGSNKYGKATWLCQCDCGNTKAVIGNSLLTKAVVSCGCYNKEAAKKRKTKHNMSYSKLYKVWQGIKTRCYDSNFIYYKNYGGRGIEICDEWLNNFINFYNWALESGYEDHLKEYGRVNTTIDRIDVNGNYEPSNCRWATKEEQESNKRTNRKITYKGETKTLSQWARKYNINIVTLSDRLGRGWTLEQALTIPTKGMYQKVFK